MAKSKYKAVIFDFDDTLVESRTTIWKLHKHVAKKFYDIDLKDEKISLHWGKPFPVLISELYENSDTVENLIKANRSQYNGSFFKKEYKGAKKIIYTLLDSDIKVGILSSAIRAHIIEDFSRLKFPTNDLFLIQSAEDTLVHKPNPRVFSPILKKLKKEGIKKNDIIYVGDSLDDLQAAHGAGIDFIAVTTGLYTKKDFQKNGAKVIIKDIKGVIRNIL